MLRVIVLLLTLAPAAFAGIPDLDESHISSAAPGLVSVFTNVDGSGSPLTEAKLSVQHARVDATITLILRDSSGSLIENYPFEDLWLETSLDGLVLCPSGSVADANTDENGITTFSNALSAGGGSCYDPADPHNEQCMVMVNGASINSARLDILFNSADLNGDLTVGVQDTAIFAGLFIECTYHGGPYDYAIDYYFDEIINLSDLVLFAGAMNTSCP